MWGISYSSNEGILILLAFIIWGSFIPSFEFIAFSPMISAECPTWAKVWWKTDWGVDFQDMVLVEPQVNLLCSIGTHFRAFGAPWLSSGEFTGQWRRVREQPHRVLPCTQHPSPGRAAVVGAARSLCVLGNGNTGEAGGKTCSLPSCINHSNSTQTSTCLLRALGN